MKKIFGSQKNRITLHSIVEKSFVDHPLSIHYEKVYKYN